MTVKKPLIYTIRSGAAQETPVVAFLPARTQIFDPLTVPFLAGLTYNLIYQDFFQLFAVLTT